MKKVIIEKIENGYLIQEIIDPVIEEYNNDQRPRRWQADNTYDLYTFLQSLFDSKPTQQGSNEDYAKHDLSSDDDDSIPF